MDLILKRKLPTTAKSSNSVEDYHYHQLRRLKLMRIPKNLCAEDGGSGAVVANRNAVAGWGTFKLIPI